MTNDTPLLMTPEQSTLGRYTLLAKIGEGGNAEIYRAVLNGPFGFTKQVAIKLIKPQKSAEEKHLRNFIKEARLGGLLRHPNIVDIYEINEANHQRFIAMELVDGASLFTILKENGPLPPSIALQMAIQVCSALSAAHNLTVNGQRAAVIHCDLKPANILLDPFGTVKVLDFGIARLMGEDPTLSIHGTLPYMAPEQILNKDITPQTDLFAFAATLYEVLTGIRLFTGTRKELVQNRLKVDQVLANEAVWAPVQARVPGLHGILARCLRRHPFERYENAVTLRADLAQLERTLSDPIQLNQWALSRDRVVIARTPVDPTTVDLDTLHSQTKQRAKTNLVTDTNVFFGREVFVGQLIERMRLPGLTTVVGLGGMGKTRLVREAGEFAQDMVSGGVWFCDMVEARSLHGLLAAIAATLDVSLEGASTDDQTQRIAHALVGRQDTILILDNAEHILQHVRDLIKQWSSVTTQTSYVVTSREPLDFFAEHIVRLGPLAPEAGEALFRERSARPLDADEPGLQDLIHQLDGMPLAIELAARRTNLFTPQDILERLDTRFQLLKHAQSEQEERHYALSAVLDSTWEALTQWEQDALTQCSVFRGGFLIEDAEEILELSSYPNAPWVVDVLQSLVDKCLLVTRRSPGGQRLNMLVSVSEYATMHLLDAEEERTNSIRQRHAQRYSHLATHPHLAQREAEHDNLIAAAEWSIGTDWEETGARCAIAAASLFRDTGPYRAGSELVERTLQTSLSPTTQGDLLLVLSSLFSGLGDPRALDKATDALTIFRSLEEKDKELNALRQVGTIHWQRGELDQGAKYYQKSLDKALDTGNRSGEARGLEMLGCLRRDQGRLDQAEDFLLKALKIHREQGNHLHEGSVRESLGVAYTLQSRMGDAILHLRQALAIHQRWGTRRHEGITLGFMGVFYNFMGDIKQAEKFNKEALALIRQIGDRRYEGILISRLGDLCNTENRLEDALAYHKQALSIHREVKNRPSEGITLLNLGELYYGMDEAEQAEAYLLDAVAICDEVYPAAAGTCRGTLALIHAKRGEFDAARTLLAQGEPQVRPNQTEYGKFLCKRAEVEYLAKNPGAARQALAAAEAVSAKISSAPQSPVQKSITRLNALLEL